MTKYCVYIKLPPFVDQFLRHSLGCPVTFPSHSVENATLHCFTTRQPESESPDTGGSGLTAISIPDSKSKPSAVYNHLTPRGKLAVAECCDLLFNRCLWNELGDLNAVNCKTTTAVYAWCERHGISIDYADTIRQRYYRMRVAYAKRGIDLRRKTRVRVED